MEKTQEYHLRHFAFGFQKKNHKYISRERGSNGKWKYFYKKISSKTKVIKNSISETFNKVFQKNKNTPISDMNFNQKSEKLIKSVLSSYQKVKIKTLTTEKIHKYVAKVFTGNGKYRYFYSNEEYERYKHRGEVLEKDYPFMQDVPVVDKKKTAKEAAKYVDVGTDNGNCTSCTIAFELQMRGYDVQSSKDIDGASFSEYVQGCFDGYDDKQGTKLNWYLDLTKEENKNYNSKGKLGLKKTTEEEKLAIAKADLEHSIVERGGDNQRGFIQIGWTKTDPNEKGERNEAGGAHVFNYVVDNGEVKFYDSQKGELNNQTGGEIDITEYLDNTDYLYHTEGTDGGYRTYMSFFRIDDKDLREGAKDYISYKPVEVHEEEEK